MNIKYHVTLTAEERNQLMRIISKGKTEGLQDTTRQHTNNPYLHPGVYFGFILAVYNYIDTHEV